jgi:hypothetical protein
MASITNWWRLESKSRDPELADALEARIADPVWLLGRQWQFGEFAGVDGGTPANARARLTVRKLGWYRPGDPGAGGKAGPLDSAVAPLDQLVESESRGPDLRLALAGGRKWLRLLNGDSDVCSTWVQAGFGVTAPPAGETPDLDGERLSAATAGIALDGSAIYAALVAATAANDFGPLPPPVATVRAAAPAYIAWWERRPGSAAADAPAWQPSRMEYELSVSTSTGAETVLTSRGYRGGGLDWPSFDFAPGATLRSGAAPAADDVVAVALPTPVTFKGMPAPRFWQFEDNAVSFPAIDAAPDDLARLFAIEFALIYGNDYFVIPVRLDTGTVSQVTSLVVDDSFGTSLLVDSSETADGAATPWHMFKLAADARGPGASPLQALLLPATTTGDLDGPPLETVLLARDEAAAMAWAVEKVVPGKGGRPLDRELAAELRKRREAPATLPPAPTGALQYRLATEVPEYWYPLLPEQTGLRAIDFELGQVALGANPTPSPLGSILAPSAPLKIVEEELNRASLRVRRYARRVRWTDGSVRAWIAREVDPGRGESSSGLRFDSVESS